MRCVNGTGHQNQKVGLESSQHGRNKEIPMNRVSHNMVALNEHPLYDDSSLFLLGFFRVSLLFTSLHYLKSSFQHSAAPNINIKKKVL